MIGLAGLLLATLPAYAGDPLPQTVPDDSPEGCGQWTATRRQGGEAGMMLGLEAQQALDDLITVAGCTSHMPEHGESRTVAATLDAFCARYLGEHIETGIAALALRLQQTGQIR